MPMLLIVFWAAVFTASLTIVTEARDDGRYASSDLKPWFDQLASGKGLCCSFADGLKIDDVDYDMQGSTENGGSGYRVRINGQWIEVPLAALITEPNKAGFAVVWPYTDANGVTQIRCFIPGTGA